MTFYDSSIITCDKFVDNVLLSVIRYVPKSLKYSTPYIAIWVTYCNTFNHSLVCIDRSEDVGVIVCSYNEITGNTSGQVLEKWIEREKWALDKLTIKGNLPIDVIEVAEVSKIFYGKEKDAMLDICRYSYYKINKDSSIAFTTRLISNGGAYSCNRGSVEHDADLLQKGGFVEHYNCIPYLAKLSQADAELRKVGYLDVSILSRTKDEKKLEVDLKEKMFE